MFEVKFQLIGLKSSTLAWISLPSEARNHQFTWTGKCLSKNKETKSRERWRISLLFWNPATWNLACMYLKHCSISWNLQIIQITHTFWWLSLAPVHRYKKLVSFLVVFFTLCNEFDSLSLSLSLLYFLNSYKKLLCIFCVRCSSCHFLQCEIKKTVNDS